VSVEVVLHTWRPLSSRSIPADLTSLSFHAASALPIILSYHPTRPNSIPSVSERILARDPMEEIRRAFQLFDDDNTGKISLRNLRRVAKEIGDRLEDDEL